MSRELPGVHVREGFFPFFTFYLVGGFFQGIYSTIFSSQHPVPPLLQTVACFSHWILEINTHHLLVRYTLQACLLPVITSACQSGSLCSPWGRVSVILAAWSHPSCSSLPPPLLLTASDLDFLPGFAFSRMSYSWSHSTCAFQTGFFDEAVRISGSSVSFSLFWSMYLSRFVYVCVCVCLRSCVCVCVYVCVLIGV